MRTNAAAFIALLAALSPAVQANPATPISAVVLYPGSATVMRTASVTPGMTQVVFSGLPGRFDLQTLRAEGGPNIRIGQIVTQDAARSDAVNPAEAEMEAKIVALQDQQAALDAEIRSAELVKNYLERLGPEHGTAGEKQAARTEPKGLSGLLEALGRGASDALNKIHRLGLQKRDIGQKIDVLQRDLNQLRTGIRNTRTVTVLVSADKPGTLNLSYQVPNAGWQPAYRAALDSTSLRLELERLATISQRTGEDWSNVRLTLSTTQPRLSPTGPDPQPWILSYQPPVQMQKLMAAPAPAPAMAPAPAEEAENRGEAPYQPPTFETHGMFATEFVVPTPVALPSDGREVSVTLSRTTLPSRHYLRVTPRLEKAAVVMAETARPQGVWLPGNMQLFRDGNYVGATHWNPASADRLVLSFGRDDLVRVAVDQVDGKSGGSGFFGNRRVRQFADLFSITNGHGTPVELLVLESSPVSSSDEIAVRASFEPVPTTENWEQRRGVVAWEKKLAPRETGKFLVNYSIEHPKEGYVGGLR